MFELILNSLKLLNSCSAYLVPFVQKKLNKKKFLKLLVQKNFFRAMSSLLG